MQKNLGCWISDVPYTMNQWQFPFKQNDSKECVCVCFFCFWIVLHCFVLDALKPIHIPDHPSCGIWTLWVSTQSAHEISRVKQKVPTRMVVQFTWLHYSRIPISIPVILVCCFYMCQIFILWWWDLWCSDPSRNHPSRPDREPQQPSCSGLPRCFCDMIKSVSLGKNKNKYPIIWPNLQFNSPGIYMFIREMTYCK
jgi:hypothetical protein